MTIATTSIAKAKEPAVSLILTICVAHLRAKGESCESLLRMVSDMWTIQQLGARAEPDTTVCEVIFACVRHFRQRGWSRKELIKLMSHKWDLQELAAKAERPVVLVDPDRPSRN